MPENLKRAILFRTDNVKDSDADAKIDAMSDHLQGLGWETESFKNCSVNDIENGIKSLETDPPTYYSRILILVHDDQRYVETGDRMRGYYTSEGGGEVEIKILDRFVAEKIEYDELTWVEMGPRSGISVQHCLNSISESALVIASRDMKDPTTPDDFNLMNALKEEDFKVAALMERERLTGIQSVQIEDHGTVL